MAQHARFYHFLRFLIAINFVGVGEATFAETDLYKPQNEKQNIVLLAEVDGQNLPTSEGRYLPNASVEGEHGNGAVSRVVSKSDARRLVLENITQEIDREHELLNENIKQLEYAQKVFEKDVANWNKLKSDIFNALEDENFLPGTRDFSSYREVLRKQLSKYNKISVSQNEFLEYYFSALPNDITLNDSWDIQVRDEDTEQHLDAIEHIQKRAKLLKSEFDAYSKSVNNLYAELLSWNAKHRSELVELRGKLITQVINEHAFALNSVDPLVLEVKTIYASLMFHSWRSEWLHGFQYRKASLVTLSKVLYLMKLVLLAGCITWLFVKRKLIIGYVKVWVSKNAGFGKWKRTANRVVDLLQELYVFIILLLLGQLLINFLVGIGISSVAVLSPILRSVVIFFLLVGIVNFVAPLLSLRDGRMSQNNAESQALEDVLTFLPKLYLYYWVISSVLSILISHHLSESLLQFYALNIIGIVFFAFLFVVIRRNRDEWRLIYDKASHAKWWVTVGERAKNTFWEPVVLLLGAGIGVYHVLWSILLDRFAEVEMAKSFQAMVSRAILEREFRRSVKKISASRFPEPYWRAFNFLIQAEQKWYVSRKENEEILQEIYDTWQRDGKRSRVLICGDRGVGKTEIIANFLRKNNLPRKNIVLQTGDNSEQKIASRIAASLGLNNTNKSFASIKEQLLSQDATVLVLENVENSFLRHVGGFDAFTLLIDLVIETSNRHCWMLTCTTHAWSIIKQAVSGADCFTSFVVTKGMTEDELKKMLLNRHKDSTANAPNFNELNLSSSKIETSRLLKNRISTGDPKDKGMELYFRILWDYTKGNPRQALYYWKASLSWEQGNCIVRLFEVPEQRVLENLEDRTLMLLAGLIEHNGLTIEGMTAIMNVSPNTVRRLIEELSPFGIVYESENFDEESWHVESFWVRAVENYLEKRQLLFRGLNYGG